MIMLTCGSSGSAQAILCHLQSFSIRDSTRNATTITGETYRKVSMTVKTLSEAKR